MPDTLSTGSVSKTCESCHEVFGCGSESVSCWCFGEAVEPDVAEDLRARFSDCVCPKCLAGESDRSG